MLAAGAFIGAGYNGMAFFSTKGTSTEKFVMKQTKEPPAASKEFANLDSLKKAKIRSVVEREENFIGRCIKHGGSNSFAFEVRLYLSIHSLFERGRHGGTVLSVLSVIDLAYESQAAAETCGFLAMTYAGTPGNRCLENTWTTPKARAKMFAKIVETIHSWHVAGWAHVRIGALSPSLPLSSSFVKSVLFDLRMHALRLNTCRVTCILPTSVSVIRALWTTSSSLMFRSPRKMRGPSEWTGSV